MTLTDEETRAERKEREALQQITVCWKCSGRYDNDQPICYKCGATNGNHDPERAQKEMEDES